MGLALPRIPRLLFREFTPISPTWRMLSVGQRNWHQKIPPRQHFCSSAPLTLNTQLDKYTRPPADFPPVQELTPRLPHICPLNNEADRIEQYLREDGHRAWGFVIYRSTYQSNPAWDEFMRRFLANTTDWLEWAAGIDLLDNLALTVIEDSKTFDGATTAVVRDHFKQWATTMLQEEQGPKVKSQEQYRCRRSQRYMFCIQVTQEELDSVLADDSGKGGFVRLIQASWKEYDPFEGGFKLEEEREPIEGCTLEDIGGWIKVPFDSGMVVPWCYFRHDWKWDIEYRRPPAISCSDI